MIIAIDYWLFASFSLYIDYATPLLITLILITISLLFSLILFLDTLTDNIDDTLFSASELIAIFWFSLLAIIAISYWLLMLLSRFSPAADYAIDFRLILLIYDDAIDYWYTFISLRFFIAICITPILIARLPFSLIDASDAINILMITPTFSRHFFLHL